MFKSDTASPVMLDERDWFHVDVVTCAAPNISRCKGRPKGSDVQKIFEKRFERVILAALGYCCGVLVLGAFGCGAFGNSPSVVAAAAYKGMEKYRYCFETFRRFAKRERMRLPHFIQLEDYVIVCGDFGLLWAKDKTFEYNLKWLSELPFTILWVQGNHDSYSMIAEYPLEVWSGVPDKVSPTYDQDRKKAIRSGLPYRVRNASWREQELPTEEELQEGRDNLEYRLS